MGKNETLTLWISVGAALFAVMLVYSYIQKKSKEVTKAFGVRTSVVVATGDINEMETVQESMVELQQVPESFVQPGYAKQIEDVVGLVTLSPINKGEQVLRNKVIKPGPETGLSLQIAPGKRALSLPVDEVRGVSRLLKPGDRVDIITALDMGEGMSKKKYIKTILQDVVILASGMNIVNELPRIYEEVGDQGYVKNLRTENKFSTITVEVSPREVQNLVYILSTNPGSLFFSLRHPSDNSKKQIQHVGLSGIFGARAPATSKKPVTKIFK